MLYPIRKQVYNLELLARWRIHNVFHVLLLEQNIIRKRQIYKFVPKFEAGGEKEYEVEATRNSIVYAKEIDG